MYLTTRMYELLALMVFVVSMCHHQMKRSLSFDVDYSHQL